MRVLLDTNVVMDVLLDREPFSAAAGELMSRAERRDIAGFASGTTVTTIHHRCSKVLGKAATLVPAHAIATRNKKDFSGARVPVYTPLELLGLLDSGEDSED